MSSTSSPFAAHEGATPGAQPAGDAGVPPQHVLLHQPLSVCRRRAEEVPHLPDPLPGPHDARLRKVTNGRSAALEKAALETGKFSVGPATINRYRSEFVFVDLSILSMITKSVLPMPHSPHNYCRIKRTLLLIVVDIVT